VVELNRDGQLHQLLSLEYAPVCAKLFSVAHLDGLSMTARFVEDKIFEEEAKKL
jgi:2-oxoglutarate ferredoxin oxidoreductase subunit alpha